MSQPRLVKADWIDLAGFVDAPIDFLYADPPFNTGATKRTPPRAAAAGRKIDAEYADDFGSAAGFIDWLRPRLAATLPLMAPTGLLCIHVDWRASHRVRVLLDELLGEDRFVNHLVWSYGLGGSSPRRFARKHDDLLLYCVDPQRYWFEPPMVPATSRRMAGQMKKATDVLDIPAINNMAAERTGYPTQKPLALLDVLVRACCPPGGLVVDPCCGSGTTLVAAVMAGRRALGLDISPAAVELANTRLGAAQAAHPVVEARPAPAADAPNTQHAPATRAYDPDA